MSDPIVSPCIKLCRIDESGMCVGCFRSVEEIENWTTYSDEMRAYIMESCKTVQRARQEHRDNPYFYDDSW
jgi:predicted Fe-S protein YdhL (DUF1289 family)